MESGAQLAPGTGASVAVDSAAPELFQKAGAQELRLTLEEFTRVLREIAAKYLPINPNPKEVRELLSSVHIEELVLARACAKGSEPAWDIFLNRYRVKLYGAAYAMVKDEAAARELADSLYADLFGTTTRDGRRVSKLNFYMGRGSLEGWLRTVLAQEYVNRYRTQRRLVSLDEQAEAGAQFAEEAVDPQQPLDARLEAATDEALSDLPGEDRFILACYYLDGRTLAEIARLLGVHESTISRKLEKIIRATRKRILKGLAQRGMSKRQAEEALEADVRDFSLDVRRRLVQEKGEPTVP
jgi:RNA polymerase sigma-70 factor (ECF subfamily)